MNKNNVKALSIIGLLVFSTMVFSLPGSKGDGSPNDYALLEWEYGIGKSNGGIAVGDIDNDGIKEIVAGSWGNGISIFNSSNHSLEKQIMWMSFTKEILIDDIDNDGIKEIVLANVGNRNITILDGKTLNQEWTSESTLSEGVDNIEIGDVDNDGTDEIVALSRHTDKIYCYSAPTQTFEWDSGSDFNTLSNGLTVDDVDGDSTQEIILTNGSKITVYNGQSQSVEWESSAEIGYFSSLTTADIDEDDTLEIIAGHSNGNFYIYDGVSHNMQWKMDVGEEPIIAVGDIDNDKILEIITTDYSSGYLKVYNANTRKREWKSDYLENDVRPYDSTLLVTDSDDDNQSEIILLTGHGTIYQFGILPPDLIISSSNIHFSHTIPDAGDTVSINATILNKGIMDVNATIQFFDGNPELDGVQIGNRSSVKVDANSTTDVNLLWDTTGLAGYHEIFVRIVDSNNTEAVLENNIGIRLAFPSHRR